MLRMRIDDFRRPGTLARFAVIVGVLIAWTSGPCRADPGNATAGASAPSPQASVEAPTQSSNLSLETAAADFERAFPFEYSIAPYQKPWSGFHGRDRIVIRAIRGNRAQIEAGGLYAVMGTYTLASMDKAVLGLFVTTDEPGITPTYRHQMKKIPKGNGSFLLWYVMTVDGDPHVSFYPASPGSEARGGVYFQDTSSSRHYASGNAKTPGAAEPVFKYYLPPSGHVTIGQPIFKNFLDEQGHQ
jgi:hypothetical protein